MKFQICLTIVALSSFCTIQGVPFREFQLESISELEPAELKREKRTLTTICVEIKPNAPYEEPYFMCKGTDMPQFSKGGSYGGGGSQSSYSSKPSHKPKPVTSYGQNDSHQPGVKIEYHAPVKPDYHPEQSKYDKPSSYDHGSHASYSSYEPTKPGYSAKPYDAHDHHDDYSKPPVHKPTYSAAYEKPSAHYEPSHGSKPQSYSHDNPSHVHYDSSAYPKGSLYEHKGSYDSKTSHSDGSYVKPSYGNSDTAYSTPHESKPTYSKPNSYSTQTSYGKEHSDQPSYGHSRPSYSEQSSSKPYSKLTYDSPTSHSKPIYSPSEYSKPTKAYGVSDKEYSPAPSKPLPSQNYRDMSEDMMQQHWDMQPQVALNDNLGYRTMDTTSGYYNFEGQRVMDQMQQQQYAPLDGPRKLDLSLDEHVSPILGSAYPSSYYNAPSSPYTTPAQSYAAGMAQAPYQSPYASSVPSYVPASPAHNPATPHGTAIQSYVPPTQVYNPPCPQSYLYSMQPTIISLPCFSPQSGYGQPVYGQSVGSPTTSIIGNSHQLYRSNINPLQDQNAARSQGESDYGKSITNNSTSIESQETDKKPDVENQPSPVQNKPETSIKPEHPEKAPEKNTQNQENGSEKPKDEQTVANAPATEGSGTKAAYQTMMRMAKIAAQLNRGDSNQSDTGLQTMGNDKPAQSQS